MKTHYAIFVAFFAALCIACPSDDKNDKYSEKPWETPANNLPETKLPARDGIPSNNTMDRLLYFVSSHEDGPGLYAYRPSDPDAGAIYVDPDLELVRSPFVHVIPRGVMDADGNISEYRAGGVMYATETIELIGAPGQEQEFPYHQYHYASSDPNADQPRYQISNTTVFPGAGLSGLFSYDLSDLRGSSFLQTGSDPVRFDLGMGADTAPLEAPKGKVMMSTIGDDLHTHNQWLYINEDDELVFYTRDFDNVVPVIDVDTSQPITGLAQNSSFISHISHNVILVGLAFQTEDENDSSFSGGEAYRIHAPDADHTNGRAERIENADGEPLKFKASLFGGLMVPSDQLLFVRNNTIWFAGGDGLESMLTPGESGNDGSVDLSGVTLTRIEGAQWSRLLVRDEELEGFNFGGIDFAGMGTLPGMLIPIDGHGAFWAPNGHPELIEANSSNPDQWKRTSLADTLPEPEDTPITESVNGWIYYNHDVGRRGGAIAYHVPSKEVIHLPGARWVGASGNGTGIGAGSASRVQMSEIFVQTKDGVLGAVEANAPDKGIVALGQLPDTFKTVSVRGPGLGPHRLIGIEHEDERFEVIAVDTTTKNSLKHLMSSPAEDWEVVIGNIIDEQITGTIQAGYTAPVNFY